MKKIKVLGLFACAFALCAILAACGGSGSSADNEKNFTGYWKATEIQSSSDAVSAEDMKLMESMGLTISLELKADKTAVFDFWGSPLNGTWKASSASKASLSTDEGSGDLELKDGKLSLDLDGDKMIFEKSTKPAASSSSSSAATSSTSS